MKYKYLIFISIISLISSLLGYLASGCTPSQDFDAQLKPIVKSQVFNIASWELSALSSEVYRQITDNDEKINDEIGIVTEYFSASGRKDALTNARVKKIIERQIRDTLTELGIFNPIAASKVNFPPVNFKLEKPPYLLVISPKDKIESIKEVTLKPTLTLKEIEDIETGVDELGMSSLIVELGGLGVTFPTFVSREASLQFTINAAVEEWLHQYLAFKPLGFLYLLDITGMSRNYEIAVMNETLAGMVSKEIGSILHQKYYAQHEGESDPSQTQTEFDFNREMREIRKTVDTYLAQGQIKESEEFMEERRQYLVSKGYYIRKLNQAYFAFYGTYADSPTSISPIGARLKTLREQSTSLKEFLNTVAAMTSHKELEQSIKYTTTP